MALDEEDRRFLCDANVHSREGREKLIGLAKKLNVAQKVNGRKKTVDVLEADIRRAAEVIMERPQTKQSFSLTELLEFASGKNHIVKVAVWDSTDIAKQKGHHAKLTDAVGRVVILYNIVAQGGSGEFTSTAANDFFMVSNSSSGKAAALQAQSPCLKPLVCKCCV